MSPLKVLNLVEYYPFYAGRVVYEIKRRLSSNGVSVKVFSSDLMTSCDNCRDGDDVIRLRARRIVVRNTPYILYGLRGLSLPVSEPDVDIIHVHFLYSLLSLYAGAMKKLNKIKAPMIVTSHGLTSGYSSAVVQLAAKLLNKLSERLLIAPSSAVTTVSKSEYSYFAEYVPYEKLFYIPNGVDTVFFKPDDTKRRVLRNRLGIDENDIVVLYFAQLRAAKGVSTLLRAMHRVIESTSQIKLFVAGCGPLAGYVKEKEGEFGAKIRTCLRYIRDEELPYLYNTCDLYVLPSYVEGMPLSVMEAMACGKPVIATNVGDVPALVKDGTNGMLVPPGNVRSLSDSIIHLVENPKLMRRMGDANLKKIAEYDWDRIAEQYQSLYYKTMSSH